MNKKTESILDEVTAGIRNEQVEPATVKQAADRVWERLSAENLELKGTMTTYWNRTHRKLRRLPVAHSRLSE